MPNAHTMSLSALPSYCRPGLLWQNGTVLILNLPSLSQETAGKKILPRDEYCKPQLSKWHKWKEIKCVFQNEMASHHQVMKGVKLGGGLKICILRMLSPLPEPQWFWQVQREGNHWSLVSAGVHVSFGHHEEMWRHQVLSSKTPLWWFWSFKTFDLFAWIFLLFLVRQIHVNTSIEFISSQCWTVIWSKELKKFWEERDRLKLGQFGKASLELECSHFPLWV